MQAQTQVKEFSVERQLRQRRVHHSDGATNGDVLDAIEALSQLVKAAGISLGPAAAAPSANGDDNSINEAAAARVEIAAMVRMISQAKSEIAAIRHPESEDDRMAAATNELDAIVMATETSTEDILAASEQIELLVRQMSGQHPDDEESAAIAEQVAAEIIKIFEACNFQDITGQRITKVVRTIRFIEEKVLAMINIWGVEAFTDLPVPQDPEADGDQALMNGPQLGSQAITQDDINALFD
jgi:chemotaxis protein CheZ